MSLEPRPARHCINIQTRGPIINLNSYQPYSTKTHKFNELPAAFEDFVKKKLVRLQYAQKPPASLLENYRVYLRNRRISNIVDCPELGETSPQKDPTSKLQTPSPRSPSPEKSTEETSFDFSRFRKNVPFTKVIYSKRRAQSLTKRAPPDSPQFLPTIKIKAKEMSPAAALETDADLQDTHTCLPTETQRITERDADLSRFSNPRHKPAFSDVPKLYSDLKSLEKAYAQNLLQTVDNEEFCHSGILSDNLKTGHNTPHPEMLAAAAVAENKELKVEMKNTKSSRGSRNDLNEKDGTGTVKEMELSEKIKYLISAEDPQKELMLKENKEEQSRFYEQLKVFMKRYRRNKSAEVLESENSPANKSKVKSPVKNEDGREKKKLASPGKEVERQQTKGERLKIAFEGRYQRNMSADLVGDEGNSRKVQGTTMREDGSRKALNMEKSVNLENQQMMEQFKGIPVWLGKKREFCDGYRRYSEAKSRRVIEICKKAPSGRASEEISAVVEWLQDIKFFAYLPMPLFRNIAERVTYRFYDRDEYLCCEGDLGDCLYIIYEGSVKGIGNGKEVKYGKYDTPGQSALGGSRVRNMDLIAATPTDVLRLEVNDYLAIMKNFSHQEKEEVANFLKTVPFLSKFPDVQTKRLAELFQTKKFSKGERVYEEGAGADSFYILRQGLMKVEATLSIEKKNVWPSETHMWMKSKLERQVKFCDWIHPKDFFGEIELCRNCRRLNNVVCEEDSQVLVLSRNDFFECFGEKQIHDLLNAGSNNQKEEPDVLKKKLLKEEQIKKGMRDIINKGWGAQLRTLSNDELEKRYRKVVKPVSERFDSDFRTFVRNNTFKTDKFVTPANRNFD